LLTWPAAALSGGRRPAAQQSSPRGNQRSRTVPSGPAAGRAAAAAAAAARSTWKWCRGRGGGLAASPSAGWARGRTASSGSHRSGIQDGRPRRPGAAAGAGAARCPPRPALHGAGGPGGTGAVDHRRQAFAKRPRAQVQSATAAASSPSWAWPARVRPAGYVHTGRHADRGATAAQPYPPARAGPRAVPDPVPVRQAGADLRAAGGRGWSRRTAVPGRRHRFAGRGQDRVHAKPPRALFCVPFSRELGVHPVRHRGGALGRGGDDPAAGCRSARRPATRTPRRVTLRFTRDLRLCGTTGLPGSHPASWSPGPPLTGAGPRPASRKIDLVPDDRQRPHPGLTAHPDDVDFGTAATIATWTDAASRSSTACYDGDAGGSDRKRQPADMATASAPSRPPRLSASASLTCASSGIRRRVEPPWPAQGPRRVIRQVQPAGWSALSAERNYARMGASHPDTAVGSAALDAVYPDARNPFAFRAPRRRAARAVVRCRSCGSPAAWSGTSSLTSPRPSAQARRAASHVSQTGDRDDLEELLRGWMARTPSRRAGRTGAWPRRSRPSRSLSKRGRPGKLAGPGRAVTNMGPSPVRAAVVARPGHQGRGQRQEPCNDGTRALVHRPGPAERAWDVLLDVQRVAPCMPGATSTRWTATTSRAGSRSRSGDLDDLRGHRALR